MKFFTLTLSLLLISACASHKPAATSEPQNSKQNIVLIQGVHLDGSSWDAVKKFFPESKFRVTDLGRVARDLETPASLKEIADLSCRAISAKTILVAHSYGGAIANAMVGFCPEKIQKMIYVSALVALKGEKPFDQMGKRDNKNYSKAVTFAQPRIVPHDAKDFFKITDASIDQKRVALPKLYSEWMSLGAEAIEYDEAKFNAIPKAYVYTKKDQIVGLKTQKAYVNHAHITQTASVQTGHFPMFSDPEGLAKIIILWAQP